jgi:hypothetical protein
MPVAPGLTIESPGEPLLDIRGLVTEFLTEAGSIRAVDGVDLRVESGQTVALVGERLGQVMVTSLSVMRLIRAARAHCRRRDPAPLPRRHRPGSGGAGRRRHVRHPRQ